MIAASDPYQVIGEFGLAFLFLAGLWWLITWIRDAPVTPDPWDAEVAQKLSDPETPEICPHCSTPQPPTAWFCSHCGKAVGPYNNLMPFLNVFSEGELLRNGTSARFRNRPLVVIGYLLVTLGINPFFAPIYWFFLLSNLNKRLPDAGETNEDLNPLPQSVPPRTRPGLPA